MSRRHKYYFPQLDSIRGLSFLAVYCFHAFHPQFNNGFWGSMLNFFYQNLVLSIDVFFILSAFLLTWLGINEYKAKGNFSFINYFIRRTLRIWPLYFLLMLFAFVLVPFASEYFHVPVTLPPAYYYLFFISNFYLEGHVFFLRFLWTLSVEEQFYLLWGICLLLFQKKLATCVIVLSTISIGYTVYAIINNINHDFNTLTYLFDFAVGIWAAKLMHSNNRITTFFKNISKKNNLVFYLLLPLIFILNFCIFYFAPKTFAPWLDLLSRYIFIIFTGLLIIEQMVNEKSLLNLKTQRFLIYTGKISYGLYCFHGIVLTFGIIILQKLDISVPIFLRGILFLVINYIVAAMSYQFIEKPFLKLKNKVRRV
ncbi:MAG TPA: acyltransferase [Ferruginibacter sp.]|nr:acyltransferase [Ferruginibacter sp.]